MSVCQLFMVTSKTPAFQMSSPLLPCIAPHGMLPRTVLLLDSVHIFTFKASGRATYFTAHSIIKEVNKSSSSPSATHCSGSTAQFQTTPQMMESALYGHNRYYENKRCMQLIHPGEFGKTSCRRQSLGYQMVLSWWLVCYSTGSGRCSPPWYICVFPTLLQHRHIQFMFSKCLVGSFDISSHTYRNKICGKSLGFMTASQELQNSHLALSLGFFPYRTTMTSEDSLLCLWQATPGNSSEFSL